MKILIIGNLGYIGPLVVRHFRKSNPAAYIAGFDAGHFSHLNTSPERGLDTYLDNQYYGDVRSFPYSILGEFDSVIYLAAVSNDPMGEAFDNATHQINSYSAIKIAKAAKDYGVKSFVFASSCSVYGAAEEGKRSESSALNPLTAYAVSKVSAEKSLLPLASDNYIITCLRFATACGFSPRLRLDLVLNDFVATALSKGKIEILSDGTPWRPLIHVKDMARAMFWASTRDKSKGGNFLIVNTGSDEWNYQIKDLAIGVKKVIKDVVIDINENAQPDKRSYMVDFSKFKELAPDYYPTVDLQKAVEDLFNGLKNSGFNDENFRDSDLIRFNVLRRHIKNGRMDNNLQWIS